MNRKSKQKNIQVLKDGPAPSLPARFIQTFTKSQAIFEENSLGEEMYIIYTGKVKLYKEKDGGRTLVASLLPGDFFGEMALIDGSPRSATAVAGHENTRLVALDRAKFLYLLRHQPEFALIIMERLCQRLRAATSLAASPRRENSK